MAIGIILSILSVLIFIYGLVTPVSLAYAFPISGALLILGIVKITGNSYH